MVEFYGPKMREPLRMAANVILLLFALYFFCIFALNFFQAKLHLPSFRDKPISSAL